MYDLLITNGHLLTLAGDGAGFVENGALAVHQGQIVAVGPAAELESRDQPGEVIDAQGGLIMPGLIDVHIHSAATAARGLAQEVDAWMGSAYGPLVRHVDDADAATWSMVALMEGVMNGTTTFGDYDYPMSKIAESHLAMGNRAVICQGVTAVDWSNREAWMAQGWKPGDPALLDDAFGEEKLAEENSSYETWQGRDNERITCIFGPVAADMLSERLLLRCQEEARKRNARLHLHVAQDPRENNATMTRAGLRAIPYLDSIGLLAPDTIAVHMSTATDEELKLVASKGSPMACCSNSIGIIDGVAPPAHRYSKLGGTVGLGSDQAAGNNSHNIFAEMRATAMFAKIKAESPLPLPAWKVLRMATIEGAKVLGIENRTGSLEVGKAADLIIVDLSQPPMLPVVLHPARNLVPNLVYGESGRDVRLSMVDGRVIYRDGAFTRIDASKVFNDVNAAVQRFEAAAMADPVIDSIPITELSRAGKI